MNMIQVEVKEDKSEKVQYHNTDYPIYISRNRLSDYPHYGAPSHWHDDIEFIAVLAGEMQYNVNGEILTMKAGEGVFVNARRLHFGYSAKKRECSFICVLLHPLLLCVLPAFERDFVLPLLKDPALSFVKLCPDRDWKQEIYELICGIYAGREEKTAPIQAQIAFLKIWNLLLEHISMESRQKMADPELTILKNMIGFVQQNYMNKLSLKAIAASGAVGQSKCCSLFAKYLKQTPNGYLTRYRLNKGMELLRDTGLSVTEVAAAAGFGGGSYFAEVFRKWMGKSPTEYRNG